MISAFFALQIRHTHNRLIYNNLQIYLSANGAKDKSDSLLIVIHIRNRLVVV